MATSGLVQKAPSGSRRAFLRHVPPVAVPVKVTDLKNGFAALLQPGDSVERFRSAVVDRTGSSYSALVSSGRAALVTILLALKRLSNRARVVVPAYGCPTVVQAVLSAGLDPVLCDVSPHTLDMDPVALERLPKDDLLAVVPTHLYGLAQDLTRLLSLSREHGFYVVEDAAQSFGATAQGRMVGTLGDAGFYSLGRGKCLPVGHGGVVVAGERCGPAIADLLRSGVAGRESTSPPLSSLAFFLGYGLATHPKGWWFVARSSLNPADAGMDLRALPPIRLGGLSAVQAAIGYSILGRLDRLQGIWRSNAQRLANVLAEVPFVQLPEVPAGAAPVWLRLPLVVDSPGRADVLYHRLWHQGIGVSRSYARSVADLYSQRLGLDSAGFPGAARLADCLLTLPTNSYLREDDWARIFRAFCRAA